MRAEWKQFVQDLGVPVRFLHRREFVAEFPLLREQPLPSAFWQNTTGAWQLFVSKAEFDEVDLTKLMQLVRNRLQTIA